MLRTWSSTAAPAVIIRDSRRALGQAPHHDDRFPAFVARADQLADAEVHVRCQPPVQADLLLTDPPTSLDAAVIEERELDGSLPLVRPVPHEHHHARVGLDDRRVRLRRTRRVVSPWIALEAVPDHRSIVGRHRSRDQGRRSPGGTTDSGSAPGIVAWSNLRHHDDVTDDGLAALVATVHLRQPVRNGGRIRPVRSVGCVHRPLPGEEQRFDGHCRPNHRVRRTAIRPVVMTSQSRSGSPR